MPYEISWEPLGIVFCFSGVLSSEELIVANDQVYSNPLFPTIRYEIVNFSQLEKFGVSWAVPSS